MLEPQVRLALISSTRLLQNMALSRGLILYTIPDDEFHVMSDESLVVLALQLRVRLIRS